MIRIGKIAPAGSPRKRKAVEGDEVQRGRVQHQLDAQQHRARLRRVSRP